MFEIYYIKPLVHSPSLPERARKREKEGGRKGRRDIYREREREKEGEEERDIRPV